MELSGYFPCDNCKCEDTMHDKDGTNWKITYEVKESRGCSHYNSYLYRRASDKPEKHKSVWVTGFIEMMKEQTLKY